MKPLSEKPPKRGLTGFRLFYLIDWILCLLAFGAAFLFSFSAAAVFVPIGVILIAYLFISNNGATTAEQHRANSYQEGCHRHVRSSGELPARLSFRAFLLLISPLVLLTILSCLFRYP